MYIIIILAGQEDDKMQLLSFFVRYDIWNVQKKLKYGNIKLLHQKY